LKDKEIAHRISTMQKNANKAVRQCLYKGCNETAIISHLLQKRGIINSIAEQQHVYEISLNAFKKDFFAFNKIGLSEALSYPGFCNKHDTELFKEVESGILDYKAYKTHLLLSYRALMIEKRKKEINIDWYNRILNARTLAPYLSNGFIRELRESIKGEEGMRDQQYHEDFFLANLENDRLCDFKFIFNEVPKIEVCSAAVFTYETSEEIALMSLFQRHKINEPLTEIYFHLLPLTDMSIVIMGCLNRNIDKCWEYIQDYSNGDDAYRLKKISDLLICQVENWVCSPSFYNNNCKKRELEINSLMRLSMKHPNERRDLELNLFEH
jgi:hypothetical protein